MARIEWDKSDELGLAAKSLRRMRGRWLTTRVLFIFWRGLMWGSGEDREFGVCGIRSVVVQFGPGGKPVLTPAMEELSEVDKALAAKWIRYRALAAQLETGPDRDIFDLALAMFSADLQHNFAMPLVPLSPGVHNSTLFQGDR